MRPEVRVGWVAFTSKFEGVCPWPYLDNEGCVTTAIGDLIDPESTALCVPFYLGSRLATPSEISAGWRLVKSHVEMELWGGGHFESVTNLRLTPEGILSVVSGRLNQIDASLAKRYPAWETYPAAVQTAILSMSWAAGPGFKAPKFDAAVKAEDWSEAAQECHLEDSHNPGLVPRNAANKALFLEAAAEKLDGTQSAVLSETRTSDDLEGTAA